MWLYFNIISEIRLISLIQKCITPTLPFLLSLGLSALISLYPFMYSLSSLGGIEESKNVPRGKSYRICNGCYKRPVKAVLKNCAPQYC